MSSSSDSSTSSTSAVGSAWEAERQKYRRQHQIKRMSVFGAAPPIPLPQTIIPIDTTVQEDDEEEDAINDSVVEGVGDPSVLSSPSSVNRIQSNGDAGDDADDAEDERQVLPVRANDEEEWLEFTCKDKPNMKLFFNPQTAQATLTDTQQGGLGNKFAVKTAGENAQASAVAAVGVGSVGSSSSGSGSEASAGEMHDRTFDRLFEGLGVISRQVELLSTYGSGMHSALTESLMAMKGLIETANAAVQKSKEDAIRAAAEERSDVDYLIGWSKLKWNLDQQAVDYYRSCSRQTNHRSLIFTDWHIPEYFSRLPLLNGQDKAVLNVHLPFSFMSSTTVEVTSTETVNDALQKVLVRVSRNAPVQEQVGQAGDYVFKALGLKEYFTGDNIFFSYAYVRKCVRDGLEHIDVNLVKTPQPDDPPEQKEADEQAIANYEKKINSSIQVTTLATHTDVPRRLPFPTSRPKVLLMSQINIPFRTTLIGLDGVNENSLPCLNNELTHLYVRAHLFHGSTYLDFTHETPAFEISSSISMHTTLQGNSQCLLSLLPRETRLAYILVGRREDDSKETLLGWSVTNLIDERGKLLSGKCDVHLWAFPSKEGKKHGKKKEIDPNFIFRACTSDNRTKGTPIVTMRVQYDEYAAPVVAPLVDEYREPNVRIVGGELKRPLDHGQSERLMQGIQADPLYVMPPDQKQLVWATRHYLIDTPQALPWVLSCVQWGRQDYRNEMYRLLRLWARPAQPIHAIELLDCKYADYSVREYAVSILRDLSDEELQLYLLQLVQCVKLEPYHDSPLSRFLIERAIRCPYQVGHTFFWHLKAELHDPTVSERFALLLEEFLSYAGRMSSNLRKQAIAVSKLQKVAENVVHLRRELQLPDPQVTEQYESELNKLNETFFSKLGSFHIPLNPKWEATTLIVKKCRYMSSKMVPLWLVFNNADTKADPITIIFKSGDDLRQDLLTLQLLRVMDSLWLGKQLDMRLKPYSCIATGVNDDGEGVGMIEVVLNSDTTSGIQLKYGGGAMGALKLEPIDSFIRTHNPNGKLYTRAVDNFVRSCAGYCVATFVLGIGDRHNGNIMVTKSGHLFHIDFGHFLGNFKTKFGINRERAAFVFTPEMAYVMGGKNYKSSTHFIDFKKNCSKAFRTLRANARLLEALFILMVGAGMPELMKETDIHYMREKLYLSAKPKEATKQLQKEVENSLNSTYRRLDNYIHNLRHGP